MPKTTNQSNQFEQHSPPNEHNLHLTLEEIYHGCTKYPIITIKSQNQHESIPRSGDKLFNVSVLPGSIPASKIYCPFEGDSHQGKAPADVVFTICEKAHPIFVRNGYNLEYTAKITLKEAFEAEEIFIPTLGNKSVRIFIDESVRNGNIKRIKQKGLPIPFECEQNGDLLVKFEITVDSQTMKQDPQVEHELQLTLEQILQGCKKKIKIRRLIIDSNENEREEPKLLTLDIKPGTKPGTKFPFPFEGDYRPGIIPADIVFIVDYKEHDIFKRNGLDLEYVVHINKKSTSSGFELSIPTLDGITKNLTIGRAVSNETVKVFKKLGLPDFDKPGERGNLLVRFEIR